MQRFFQWGLRVDAPYKVLALTPIIVGVSVLLSAAAITDTTVTWMLLSLKSTVPAFGKDLFGSWMILDGFILLIRRRNRYEFVLLYLPIWLLAVGLIGFIVATSRASSVGVLVVCLLVFVLAVIRWGFTLL